MTGQQLKNSILQEAIQGRLVPNVLQPGEKTGAELLQDILAERQKKEIEEKGKKAKKLSLSIIEEEPWELPEGWCWCKLGDVGDFTRGNGIKKDEVIENGYPCVRYGELYTRYKIQFSSIISSVNKQIYDKCQKIETGDVVMALTGENEYDIALASVYLGTIPVAMGGDMTKLHPFVDSKYLVYTINSPYAIECKSQLATGQIIVHISNDKLASISIPLPPLSIQKAIVDKIEELFPIVDEYDKAAGELKALNEALPDKLRKSVLQEAIHGNLVPNKIPAGEATAQELLQQILKDRQDRENAAKGKKAKKLTLSEIEEEPWELPEGWCWCVLSDYLDVRDGTHDTPKYVSSGYPLITSKNLNNGSVDLSNIKLISEEDYISINERSKVDTGDILFAMIGSIGNPAIVKEEHEYAIKNVALFKKGNYSYELYTYYALLLLQEQMKQESSGGIQSFVSLGYLRSFKFPLPPLSIQKAIVAKIEEVFAAIDKLK